LCCDTDASINFANLLHDWQDDSECSIPSSKNSLFWQRCKIAKDICLPMKHEALTERIIRGSRRMFVASGYHIRKPSTLRTNQAAKSYSTSGLLRYCKECFQGMGAWYCRPKGTSAVKMSSMQVLLSGPSCLRAQGAGDFRSRHRVTRC
jgi:hypothetical protein